MPNGNSPVLAEIKRPAGPNLRGIAAAPKYVR